MISIPLGVFQVQGGSMVSYVSCQYTCVFTYYDSDEVVAASQVRGSALNADDAVPSMAYVVAEAIHVDDARVTVSSLPVSAVADLDGIAVCETTRFHALPIVYDSPSASSVAIDALLAAGDRQAASEVCAYALISNYS